MACSDQVITDRYALYNGDSAEVLAGFPDQSVHLSIYSPPFACDGGGCLYTYSSSERDLSNARSYGEFFEHYAYIVEQITRLTLPGRISAVHCMDVPKDGANIAGSIDFPGDIIRLHESLGWDMLPRICIWKEPLAVRNRTMAKALAHRTVVEDSTQVQVAGADYLIPFRKRGKNPMPVAHPTGLMSYAGESEVPADRLKYRGWTGDQTKNLYSHWIWRRYASCIWDDIRVGRTLPRPDNPDDEAHMHPLQLDVIERAVVLWSNPGETVLTPFLGVGSEVYGAVLNGRRGIGIELKTAYFKQAVDNLASLAAAENKPAEDDADQLALPGFTAA